jgi:hypothetical protein
VLPGRGVVLELASATGQHIEHFARALPNLIWQPSDYDAEHVATLQERVRRANLANLVPPLKIDVTETDWPITRAHAVFNANMIHIAPWAVTVGLFAGAARLLQAGAPLVSYGPYSIDGQHISDSNRDFDESLKSRNPEWGVRDTAELSKVANEHGFTLEERVQMPANNFTLIWRKG